MSLDGQLVCIFGGGGFVGRYVAQQLLSRGARIRVAQRHVKNAMHIKPLGNLGQVQFASADVTKADSVTRAICGCSAVINLAGVFGSEMDAVNDIGARQVAEAAARANCQTLVHISAIGADRASPSRYGRSRAAGEEAVKRAFPGATILRPSIIFGREDEFINRFATLIQMSPVVPIIGGETKFQPVFVGDVAEAVAEVLEKPSDFAGQIFELGGPEVISMSDLNHRIAKMTGHDRSFIEVPDIAAKLLAMLPGSPISSDQYKMLQTDNVASPHAKGLDAFGVSATPLAAVARGWMETYVTHGRFGTRVKAG